jgi:hypothetical protein
LTSVSKAHYDFKGDPSKIRAHLDESRKVDLRGHHFSYGSHTNAFTSTQQSNNQGMSNAAVLGGNKPDNKSLLKASGASVF